jgi:hypothetical protein
LEQRVAGSVGGKSVGEDRRGDEDGGEDVYYTVIVEFCFFAHDVDYFFFSK